ncbi:MAG: hypothetical protein PVI26_07390, partial [Chitinispirillia bacterium]
HRVQYKFDFDDDSTDWTGPRGYVYIWKSSGKKRIRFMKRCSKNRYAESDWSPPVEIEVK